MAKTTREIFNDKVSLIYEYDNSSPLFVRKANIEIENNNLQPAVEILHNGLKLYPQYSTAYLVLGKAQILMGNYREALKNIKKGSDLIPSPKTYGYYLEEIENIKKQRSLFNTSKRNAFMLSDETENINQQELFEEEKEAGNETLPESSRLIDENLEQLAQKISKAKIPGSYTSENQDESVQINLNEDNMIISETLAKIYIAQGEYNEAISVYKKLNKKNPAKSDYYDEKIAELRSQLE